MKNKTYTTPKLEIVEICNAPSLLASTGSTQKMKKGDIYSEGEQFSQERQQESIWDEMGEE